MVDRQEIPALSFHRQHGADLLCRRHAEADGAVLGVFYGMDFQDVASHAAE